MTLFTGELPFLSGTDIHDVMGEALSDGWTGRHDRGHDVTVEIAK